MGVALISRWEGLTPLLSLSLGVCVVCVSDLTLLQVEEFGFCVEVEFLYWGQVQVTAGKRCACGHV